MSGVSDCNRCGLREGCGQVVWGEGGPSPVMVIGESPSSEDDLMGVPFSGREGVLLWKLLERAGLSRREVYVTHLVKCMGKPKVAHIKACGSWLWQEIQKVSPKVVVPLGNTATRTLLKLKASEKVSEAIGGLHGVAYMTAKVAPWHAPSLLLNRGRAMDDATVEFLTRVKAHAYESVPPAPETPRVPLGLGRVRRPDRDAKEAG